MCDGKSLSESILLMLSLMLSLMLMFTLLEMYSLLETFSFPHFARNALNTRGVLISSYHTHLYVPSPVTTYLTRATALTTAHFALSTDESVYEHL